MPRDAHNNSTCGGFYPQYHNPPMMMAMQQSNYHNPYSFSESTPPLTTLVEISAIEQSQVSSLESPSNWKTRVGINGFGRIGRLVLQVATYRGLMWSWSMAPLLMLSAW